MGEHKIRIRGRGGMESVISSGRIIMCPQHRKLGSWGGVAVSSRWVLWRKQNFMTCVQHWGGAFKCKEFGHKCYIFSRDLNFTVQINEENLLRLWSLFTPPSFLRTESNTSAAPRQIPLSHVIERPEPQNNGSVLAEVTFLTEPTNILERDNKSGE